MEVWSFNLPERTAIGLCLAFGHSQKPAEGFVTSRQKRRQELQKQLVGAKVPQRLAKEHSAVLWKLQETKHYVEATLDRKDYGAFRQMAESPEALDKLAAWLQQHHPQFATRLNTLRSEPPERIAVWVKGLAYHLKKADPYGRFNAFLHENFYKPYEESLRRWLEPQKPAIAKLLGEALNRPAESIALSSRLLDTCCLAPCGDCLNGAGGEDRKQFVAVA